MAKRKKEMLEIVDSLSKRNRMIANGVNQNVCPQIELLAECQQLAFDMGVVLETYGKDSEKIVQILEDYCECLYQVSISKDDMEQCRRLVKKVKKQLIKVYNGIRFEIPEDKKEIVFLPYKASMWDSMESVWKAAVYDERCDVFVVPIPYFDKESDGTLGKMHYEGDEYPEYVPIVSWQDFSIEEHMPDIIYIHNPYDQYNYVTSVHPDFYASRLKKYTDKLVYIPYFTANNSNVPEHFVTLPGVLYADRVIVQSERARQIYIKKFHEFEKQNHCESLYGKPEDKILALGSPKYDKVMMTKRKDVFVPKEWEKILATEDFI